jgi:hypothetical protein
MVDKLDTEQRRIIGNEARQLLENRHLKEAFEAVEEYLDQAALGCDPDNKDKAARIIISKQLLAAIKREIERKIEDGEIANIEISELERKKGLLRFIR